jgi:hypothetical protein
VRFTRGQGTAKLIAPFVEPSVRGAIRSELISFPHPYSSDQLDSLPGGMFGSAGVLTRPPGYIRDGSRADSGIPPAASRQLHSPSHRPARLRLQQRAARAAVVRLRAERVKADDTAARLKEQHEAADADAAQVERLGRL